MALPINEFAEKLVFAPSIVGILLLITGVLLLVSEKVSRHRAPDTEQPLNLSTSVKIALAQGLAVLPGFSRSGWTIAAGLFSGLSREQAAKYSFLLSIPIILGASMMYPVMKIDLHEAAGFNWSAIIAGTLVSGLTGYFCIKYFIKFVSKFSLAVFGYYCIIAGAAAAIFFGLA
jgi:undecaprenyl-diphosphatase